MLSAKEEVVERVLFDKISLKELGEDDEADFTGKLQPRCSISQFIRRMAFTIYHAAFFLEGRQSKVGITLLSRLLSNFPLCRIIKCIVTGWMGPLKCDTVCGEFALWGYFYGQKVN